PRDATDEAVRIAFRKAAKAHHPDLNLGDPAAEPQLRQIIAAYQALKTAQQRAVYNQFLAKEEQFWRSIGRRNKKQQRFVQPVAAGLVSGSAVALAVWMWLSPSHKQDRSQTPQTSRMTATASQPPSQQAGVADDSSRLSKQDSSSHPVETSVAPGSP